jgi:hypothetical protein
MSDDLLKDDEIVIVKLPRDEYEIVRQMIKERQAMNLIKGWLTTWWVWVVAGSVLSVWTLWDKIKVAI